MALKYLPISMILVLVVPLLNLANGEVYYVSPSVAECPVNVSCNTLDHYAKDATQQLSDSVFYFKSGTHNLQRTWVIRNARNVTMSGRLPDAERDEKVLINCTTSGTDSGLRVINTPHVRVNNLEIIHCQHHVIGSYTELTSAALSFQKCYKIELSNLIIGFSSKSCCLHLRKCGKYVITKSLFTSCGHAIDLKKSSGILTLTNLLNNDHGIRLADDLHFSIQMDSIYAFNNSFAFSFVACSATISLKNSRCIQGYYGFFAQKMYKSLKNKELNITVQNVTVEYTQNALFFKVIPSVEITNITIRNNEMVGLVMHDSVVYFGGTNTFSNNSGVYGGAIALYENSYIFLEQKVTLKFINNSADKFGAGIFVSQIVLGTERWILCFMQFSDYSPNIIFEGNKAGYTGSNIYGGNIDICNITNRSLALINLLGSVTSAAKCNQTNVSSIARMVKFCDNQCINETRNETVVSAYPGKRMSLTIAAIGQLQGLTQATVLLNYDEEVFHYEQKDSSEIVHASCTTISRDILVKRIDKRGKIKLTVSDDFIPSSINQPITIVINLLSCPPGFAYSPTNGTCACSNSIQDYARCNITSKTISRNHYSWIFPTNKSIMVFEHCPFDYCNNQTFHVDDPDRQCNYNRSGTLCGDCIPGYSLTLGSNQCLDCTERVWQLPIIVLGSALAGIGLVTALIGLNLTVSSGTINGLVFFVNVVRICEPVFMLENYPPVLRYILLWLNLDLGVVTCFFHGMNACEKVALQFLFPLYLMSLVLVIVAVCRSGQWVLCRSSRWILAISHKTTRLMGSSIIPVLATLLLLSYTKLIRTIIVIYHRADIQVYECNTSVAECENTSRWYMNGSVEYATGCHGVLFGIASAIFSTLVILFTVFLLAFPLLECCLPRFKHCRSWHIRLKPWYDAYGGQFKDRYRSWTGLLLIARCALAFLIAFEKDPKIILSTLYWALLLLNLLLMSLQVYKSFVLNLLEIALFYLLQIMTLVSLADNSGQLWLIVSFALSLSLGVLVFHVCKRLKVNQVVRLLYQTVVNRSENAEENQSDTCESSEESHRPNRSKVSVTVVTVDGYDEVTEPLIGNCS